MAYSTLGSGQMFDAIAPKYDRLNFILSFGLDRWWRRAAVRALALVPGARVLDVATGTGDLAIAIARASPGVVVSGVDTSPRMLDHAKTKIERRGLADRVRVEVGDAERLPFERGAFQAASMAFGIRNVRDRPAALRELARVVVPGGRIAILELSDPSSFALGWMARFYVHRIVPRIGAAISDAAAYGYLERSIAAFPPPAEFEAMMEAAGIEPVERRSFAFGASVLFVGRVKERGAS